MIRHSITAFERDPDCTTCDEDGFVCEDHPDQPWGTSHQDECGAPGTVCSCVTWVCGFRGPEHPETCP